MSYRLTFAGVPFVSDQATVIRMPDYSTSQFQSAEKEAVRKQQPTADLINELNRKLPFQYLNDFQIPNNFPGKNTGNLAHSNELGPFPNPSIRIGDYYYPTGMRRWSVFRGLATSSQVKEMMRQCSFNFNQGYTISASGAIASGAVAYTSGQFQNYVSGSVPFSGTMNTNPSLPSSGQGLVGGLFVMDNKPDGASTAGGAFRITTPMFLLPPRPIAEGAGLGMDGLYLVTLVDERYFMQTSPALLQVKQGMTWEFLLDQLAISLGIQLNTLSAIESVYTLPELDSQLWTNFESATFLLDSVAYNVGRTIARNFDGTYTMYTPSESNQIARSNRRISTSSPLVRTAGGDMFQSGTNLPVGDIRAGRNTIVPNKVHVTFPKYIIGNDPVPHFADPRYQSPRRSVWYEDSYGSVYKVVVPIESGGIAVSGIAGTGDMYLHDTAKALLSGEAAINSGEPLNNSGLVALSVRLASDYYNAQALNGLDEVYPGILSWTPEGLNDVLYTFSERARGAYTRVMRKAWTDTVEEFQHATPPASGFQSTQPGVGGKSVAQTIRDGFANSGTFIGMSGGPFSGSIYTTLSQTLQSGSFTASFNSYSYFPATQRWYGKINKSGIQSGSEEIVLFEGTSGGVSTVRIVQRGIQGTIQREHDNGSEVTQVTPNTTHGVNLVSFGTGQFAYPGASTSGGVQEIKIVPQTQTVRVLDTGGVVLSGIRHFSGVIDSFDATKMNSGGWIGTDFIWIIERTSGNIPAPESRYDGQFIGWAGTQSGGNSGEVRPAPVYAINANIPFNLNNIGFTPITDTLGAVTRTLAQPLFSGSLYSGIRYLVLNDIGGLPTQNRWWAQIINAPVASGGVSGAGEEIILMDGIGTGLTSGPQISGYRYGQPLSGQLPPNIIAGNLAPANFGFFVRIIQRGMLGTTIKEWVSGSRLGFGGGGGGWSSGINQLDFTAGAGREAAAGLSGQGSLSLGVFEGNYVFPGGWLSGTREAVVRPQWNLLKIDSASGTFWSGTIKYPAKLIAPGADDDGNNIPDEETGSDVWVQNIHDVLAESGTANGNQYVPVTSGGIYLGFFGGFSYYISGGGYNSLSGAVPTRDVYWIDLPFEPPQSVTAVLLTNLTGGWYAARLCIWDGLDIQSSGINVLAKIPNTTGVVDVVFTGRRYLVSRAGYSSASGRWVYTTDSFISG